MASPNSFSDPYWTDLAGRTEQKLDLPAGLLVGVLTKGERSNADQVSEAGARTPFQIIPATRRAAIEKYKIDPYLSDENAAEVAGKLLKDSLDRNNNNPVLAISEYHGGTNRDNWGPRTKAYAKRVVGMSPDHPEAANAAPASASQGTSTFDRVSQQMGFNAVPESSIANIFKAYQGGQMSADESQAFEDDVGAGRIMLPRGAALNSAAAPAAGNVLPAGVLDAYASGQMTPDEKGQLERDLKAGHVSLPQGAILGQSSAVAAIPGTAGADGTIPAMPSAPAQPADPTLVDRALGVGEAGLTMLTGATTGAMGMIDGAISGAVGNLSNGQYGNPAGVEAGMAQGMANGVYQPRTETGQSLVDGISKAAMAVPVVAGLGMEMGVAGRAAAAGAARVGDLAATSVQRIRAAAPAIAERVERTLRRNPDPVATPGTQGSVGAAGVDMADQRTMVANNLPNPIKLTEGQATRNPDQLRFEMETAKGDRGGPIRDRYSEQNDLIQKNFDSWVDQTGKTTSDVTETGKVVDQVLRKELDRNKAEVRVKYREADKSPEALAAVDPGEVVSIGQGDNAIEHSVVSYLNSKPSGLSTTALTDHAKQYAVKLGVAELAEDGTLVAKPSNVKTMEALRKEISQATGYEPMAKRDSAILKGIIDAQTEPLAGPLYRDARRARENLSRKWENRGVVSDLVSNKRGMDDRKVAIEDVFKHIILDGDRSEVGHMRSVLQRAGEDGQQAWKELQGQTVQWIKDESTKNVATDQRGNRIVSAAQLDRAITKLETGKKLDFIFGKAGAQQMRDINDLTKMVMTTPPGAVNTSNTASVLLAALTEAGVTGSLTGLPVPVMTGLRMLSVQVKNRKLQQRIEAALNRRAPPPSPRPPGATVH